MTHPATLAAALRGRRTLCQGQADDLKLETPGLRLWLSRCGILDGEPFEETVSVEALRLDIDADADWQELCRIDGASATTDPDTLEHHLRSHLGADISHDLAGIIARELDAPEPLPWYCGGCGSKMAGYPRRSIGTPTHCVWCMGEERRP
jgi:hypothetical protein